MTYRFATLGKKRETDIGKIICKVCTFLCALENIDEKDSFLRKYHGGKHKWTKENTETLNRLNILH